MNNPRPFDAFMAALNPVVANTGGGCQGYEIPTSVGYALVTTVDDPSLPRPDDEKVDVGFYDREGEWLGEQCFTVTWAEAIAIIEERL